MLIDWIDEEDVNELKITTDFAINRKITDNISLPLYGVKIFNVYPAEQDTKQSPVIFEIRFRWVSTAPFTMAGFFIPFKVN